MRIYTTSSIFKAFVCSLLFFGFVIGLPPRRKPSEGGSKEVENKPPEIENDEATVTRQAELSTEQQEDVNSGPFVLKKISEEQHAKMDAAINKKFDTEFQMLEEMLPIADGVGDDMFRLLTAISSKYLVILSGIEFARETFIAHDGYLQSLPKYHTTKSKKARGTKSRAENMLDFKRLFLSSFPKFALRLDSKEGINELPQKFLTNSNRETAFKWLFKVDGWGQFNLERLELLQLSFAKQYVELRSWILDHPETRVNHFLTDEAVGPDGPGHELQYLRQNVDNVYKATTDLLTLLDIAKQNLETVARLLKVYRSSHGVLSEQQKQSMVDTYGDDLMGNNLPQMATFNQLRSGKEAWNPISYNHYRTLLTLQKKMFMDEVTNALAKSKQSHIQQNTGDRTETSSNRPGLYQPYGTVGSGQIYQSNMMYNQPQFSPYSTSNSMLNPQTQPYTGGFPYFMNQGYSVPYGSNRYPNKALPYMQGNQGFLDLSISRQSASNTDSQPLYQVNQNTNTALTGQTRVEDVNVDPRPPNPPQNQVETQPLIDDDSTNAFFSFSPVVQPQTNQQGGIGNANIQEAGQLPENPQNTVSDVLTRTDLFGIEGQPDIEFTEDFFSMTNKEKKPGQDR